MKKPGKPGIPPSPKAGEDRQRFDSAVKETLEIIKGDRGGRIALLETTASTADIIDKINELIERLQ